MKPLSNTYIQTLQQLKDKIKHSRIKASLTVNKQMLEMYWEIGHTILLQQQIEGWGAKVIDQLAADLLAEFPDMKGLSARNLKYMRAFATTYPNFLIVQQAVAQTDSNDLVSGNEEYVFMQRLVAQLPWGHHCVILDKLKTDEERLFYAEKIIENNWSRDVLKIQIESNLKARQGQSINNFANILPLPQADLAKETLKSSYLFDFLSLGEEMKERDVENVLILHLKKFMLELGRGFAYVGNQYNLKVENDDYYLDLLFYNTRLHAYIIFELKIGDFKPEFAGKLNFYVNAVDKQIKGINDNPTIGVLLCKTPNKTEIQYALHGINTPLGVAEYALLPEELKEELPSIAELEMELEKEIESVKNPLGGKIDQIKDIISKVKGEKKVIKKSNKHIPYLFSNALIPIIDNIKQLLVELIPMFNETEITYYVNDWGNQYITLIDVELKASRELIYNEKVNRLGFEFALKGFNQADTNVFNIRRALDFAFEEYRYQIKLDHVVERELLYSQLWTETEVKKISQLLADGIMDDIKFQLERIKQ